MPKFHPKNYTKNNTPKTIQTIGDIMLLAGAIGGIISVSPIALPVAVTTAAGYLLLAGSIGKAITKFFGTEDPDRKLVD